eukprot:CAMPEP_0194041838 /NCGR_PEP_ID=MMETSP0009_2-20130614/13658_1 /TAXON_ID=210454 /ORGANISM="Grammatophora oceanica, Strain CCMP 410" /LENGTH=136 /DNA_ID=CAMNT_0038685453 /DNA_START=1 /DNA_END=411 /DNA_ORIENTATION=+
MSLKEYEVWPVDKVKSSLMMQQQGGNNGLLGNNNNHHPLQVNQQQLEYYNTHMFDLENSPLLLQSRRQGHPRNALLPVVFVAKQSGNIFIMPNFSEIFPDHITRNTVTKCDKKARKAFQQLLQQVKFPPVVSPELQ